MTDIRVLTSRLDEATFLAKCIMAGLHFNVVFVDSTGLPTISRSRKQYTKAYQLEG